MRVQTGHLEQTSLCFKVIIVRAFCLSLSTTKPTHTHTHISKNKSTIFYLFLHFLAKLRLLQGFDTPIFKTNYNIYTTINTYFIVVIF
jgi:hypothetical protein